jgi:hypothetical protein
MWLRARLTRGDSMTRGHYLQSGDKQRGRAGWLEHLQETSPRHGPAHAPGELKLHPGLPSALADERLPGGARPEPPRGGIGGAPSHA